MRRATGYLSTTLIGALAALLTLNIGPVHIYAGVHCPDWAKPEVGWVATISGSGNGATALGLVLSARRSSIGRATRGPYCVAAALGAAVVYAIQSSGDTVHRAERPKEIS
jgi:hypothetical protein